MKKQKNAQLVLPREEWPYEVPENWVWTNLQSICAIPITDGTHKTPTYCDAKDGFPFISSKDVTDQHINWNNIKYITPELHNELYARLAPQIDDILLAKNGTTGVAALVETDQIFDIYVTLAVIRPNQIIINPKYIFHLVNSPLCKQQFNEHLTGIGLPNLHLRDIKATMIPLPPLPEQQRIVARIESLFAKLDTAAEKIRAALDQFPIRKAAILHKAFMGELTKKWREENGVGMESWEYKILSETDLKIIDGDRGTNYPKREELTNTGYCVFLNAKNVTKDGFSFDEVQFISYEKDSLLRTGKLERGDIVLTTRGTIGNTAYYDESIPYQNVRINSGMVIYRGGTQFFKPFLMWFYKSEDLSQQIEKLKTGTAQPQLPIKVMNNLLLPIPLIKEQKEIVRILDVIFEREQAAKETAERLLEQIALTKKSILARAFRGLLGTNDPKEESAEGWLEGEEPTKRNIMEE